ncbi:Rhotekin-like protein [Leptotrombidium deliense]|uniref:Rhotekin-like protein n=1 Tax=Leptotrombidium deliense TaxID=299467 RepID=A0A443SDT2_9ACAR|nr:Rhotekin-like protein [Leptotrombidium deliense]
MTVCKGNILELSEDYDLEQKIDLEIKMREGTTKLLAACKHPVQSMEASKSLMTSNQRMTAYISELQKRKVREKLQSDPKKSHTKVEASKARVSVSDIRIPLIWKDSDHFKNKGDYRRFAVFCLLKIGTEIYDSALVNNIDRTVTDISFDDIVVFHHIPANFECKLEVYCKVLHDDLSIASTPKKIKKKISSSMSRTFGRKMAASLKDEFNENGPKFDLIAEATLTLKDSSDCIKTHDLTIEAENRQSTLPLFGHFCCRLAVNPDCLHEERLSSYLRVYEFTGKIIKDAPVYWVSLRSFKLCFWKKRREEMHMKSESPNIVIPVTENLRVNLVNSNTFTIETNETNVVYSLSVINDQDLQLWVAHIKQHVEDYVSWGNAAKNAMDIPSPSPNRIHMFLRQRPPGTLYDETPLSGNFNIFNVSKFNANFCRSFIKNVVKFELSRSITNNFSQVAQFKHFFLRNVQHKQQQ